MENSSDEEILEGWDVLPIEMKQAIVDQYVHGAVQENRLKEVLEAGRANKEFRELVLRSLHAQGLLHTEEKFTQIAEALRKGNEDLETLILVKEVSGGHSAPYDESIVVVAGLLKEHHEEWLSAFQETRKITAENINKAIEEFKRTHQELLNGRTRSEVKEILEDMEDEFFVSHKQLNQELNRHIRLRFLYEVVPYDEDTSPHES